MIKINYDYNFYKVKGCFSKLLNLINLINYIVYNLTTPLE